MPRTSTEQIHGIIASLYDGADRAVSTASRDVAEDINQQITRIAQLCDHSAGQAKQGAAISQETGRFLLRQGLRQLMLIICRSELAREGR
jgi:methyl-accepting chemotaxis protein